MVPPKSSPKLSFFFIEVHLDAWIPMFFLFFGPLGMMGFSHWDFFGVNFFGLHKKWVVSPLGESTCQIEIGSRFNNLWTNTLIHPSYHIIIVGKDSSFAPFHCAKKRCSWICILSFPQNIFVAGS